MRSTRFAIGLLAALMTVTSAVACAHTDQASGDVSPSNAVFVKVVNNNYLDMDVFSVVQGVSTRLGMVTGNGSGNFVMDRSLGAADVRIVATPIGGAGRATTGGLAVTPGQTIEFRIAPNLGNSSVIIR